MADSFDSQTCPYGLHDYDLNNTVFHKAIRYCQSNFVAGAQWQAPNISECAFSTATNFKLAKISQVIT